MAALPSDVCNFQDEDGNECNEPFEIDKTNSQLFCFLLYPRANHIESHCPKGHEQNLFVTPEGFMQIIQVIHLPVMFGLVPSANFRERCIATIGPDPVLDEEPSSTSVDNDSEIDPPHWMLRELYDQLREYEGEN
jgi:hypothetical protein